VAKGPDAFRTISEAADELSVPQHVLRFWETKFAFIRPMKRAGGRRFYRPSDIAVLRGVRRLLHDEGYTIKGVQRLHREEGLRRLVSAGGDAGAEHPAHESIGEPARASSPPAAAPTVERESLYDALRALETAKQKLDGLLK
jgi:DNA-binding transcriptional MerR regulator